MLGQVGKAMHQPLPGSAPHLFVSCCWLATGLSAKISSPLSVILPAHCATLCSAGEVGQATDFRAFCRSQNSALQRMAPQGGPSSQSADQPFGAGARQALPASAQHQQGECLCHTLLVSTAPCSGSRAATTAAAAASCRCAYAESCARLSAGARHLQPYVDLQAPTASSMGRRSL